MQRKWVLAAASMVLATLLTGCMDRQGDQGNRNIRSHAVRQDANGNLTIDKRFANDQMNEMNRVNGRRLNSNNVIGSHQNYRIEMNEEIASRITEIRDVRASHVVLSERNAYVAIDMDNVNRRKGDAARQRVNANLPGVAQSGKVTGRLKNEISTLVREMKPDIENVYVSANPDFFRRMTNYWQDAREGRSIQDVIAEFNAMADRMFPLESGRTNR